MLPLSRALSLFCSFVLSRCCSSILVLLLFPSFVLQISFSRPIVCHPIALPWSVRDRAAGSVRQPSGYKVVWSTTCFRSSPVCLYWFRLYACSPAVQYWRIPLGSDLPPCSDLKLTLPKVGSLPREQPWPDIVANGVGTAPVSRIFSFFNCSHFKNHRLWLHGPAHSLSFHRLTENWPKVYEWRRLRKRLFLTTSAEHDGTHTSFPASTYNGVGNIFPAVISGINARRVVKFSSDLCIRFGDSEL